MYVCMCVGMCFGVRAFVICVLCHVKPCQTRRLMYNPHVCVAAGVCLAVLFFAIGQRGQACSTRQRKWPLLSHSGRGFCPVS